MTISTAMANSIDSLSTKEAVQKFLVASLGKGGIIYLDQCADISQTEKKRAYLSQPRTDIRDSIPVQDPVTDKWSVKVMPHEFNPDCLCCNDTTQSPMNYPLEKAAVVMAEHPWYFHKADIDRNGYTDLVVDAGIVVVVMDVGGRFEGYMFAEDTQLSFLNFISLPDGSAALLLKNNYELCSSGRPRPCSGVDTIVYKFHGFAKYNPRFTPVGIAKIVYQFNVSEGTNCDGQTCIEIKSNGQCLLHYSQYKAVFSAVPEGRRLSDLWNLIAYVDVNAKKDWYYDWVDHSEGSIFTVYFDDGAVKTICTWGYRPPLGVDYIGRSISEISRELHWQLLEGSTDFECPKLSNPLPNDFRNDCNCSL